MNRKKRVIQIRPQTHSYSHTNNHYRTGSTSCAACALLVCTSTAAMSTLFQ